MANRFSPRRTRSALSAAFLCCALTAAGTAAGAAVGDELFTVSDLEVEINLASDAEAHEPAEARNVALERGRRQAFETLLGELADSDAASRLPQLPDGDIAAFVDDVEIAGETFADRRYRARTTWRFKRKLVTELLAQFQVPFVAVAAPPLHILPTYGGDGFDVSGEDDHGWLKAWRDQTFPSRFLSYRLTETDTAQGDKSDTGDDGTADTAPITVTVRAHPLTDGDGAAYGLVIVTRAHGGIAGEAGLFDGILRNVLRRQQESDDALAQRAALEVFTALEARWKNFNAVSHKLAARPFTLVIFYRNLKHWLAIRKALEELAAIGNFTVLSLARTHAEVRFTLNAGLDNLKAHMARLGLDMSHEHERWVAKPTRKDEDRIGRIVAFESSFLTKAQADRLREATRWEDEQARLAALGESYAPATPAPTEEDDAHGLKTEDEASDAEDGEDAEGGVFGGLLETLFGGTDDDAEENVADEYQSGFHEEFEDEDEDDEEEDVENDEYSQPFHDEEVDESDFPASPER